MGKDSEITARGGCLCGGVKFDVRGELSPVTYCHCKQCRISHGHFIGYSNCAKDDLHLTSDSTLTWFHSSEAAKRGFCNTCGSSLFWRRKNTDRISIAAGCLDDPTHLTAAVHIFVGSAGDYYKIEDGLPCFVENN